MQPVARPKIFVGTLACNEAEFSACCQSICEQQDVEITHHVIANQPEFEAHNQLWKAWANAKHTHGLMVKIDADTVLSRPTALAEIVALFENSAVTGAQILLHDYFTDRLIAGLNAFSPVVVFKRASTRLFADHADRNHNIVLKGDAVAHLAPIGWHCTNPHPRQAFHYGLHRALKKQHDVIKQCAAIWLSKQDDARSWALAGAMSARWRMRGHFDYTSDQFEKAFLKFESNPNRLSDIQNYATSLIR